MKIQLSIVSILLSATCFGVTKYAQVAQLKNKEMREGLDAITNEIAYQLKLQATHKDRLTAADLKIIGNILASLQSDLANFQAPVTVSIPAATTSTAVTSVSYAQPTVDAATQPTPQSQVSTSAAVAKFLVEFKNELAEYIASDYDSSDAGKNGQPKSLEMMVSEFIKIPNLTTADKTAFRQALTAAVEAAPVNFDRWGKENWARYHGLSGRAFEAPYAKALAKNNIVNESQLTSLAISLR